MQRYSDNRVAGMRRERGQSLAVALIVMFVLLFIGGLFVALVARNLLSSGRTTDTIEALRLAQAGCNYASSMLQNSPEGADWRPVPPPPPPSNAALLAIYNADPDRRWLDAGYSRIPLGRGRALIRIDYTPDPRDPTGKYIRIRSVGRVGTVTDTDPTTFVDPATGTVSRLRREELAIKQIGITDYLRYVTNLDRDSSALSVIGGATFQVGDAGTATVPTQRDGGLPVRLPSGVPAWWQVPYPVNGSQFNSTGAPIYVNNNVQFVGNTIFGLRSRYDLSTSYPWNTEAIRVAGTISLGINSDVQVRDLSLDPTASGGNLFTVRASSDPNFTTGGGDIRDDAGTSDAFGYSRETPYLAPPLMDGVDTSTGVDRYTECTRDSGIVLQRWNDPSHTTTTSFNTGAYGLGAGLYIDNFNNFEQQTRVNDGGQSLRSIWLKPGSTQYWAGPYYVPPGVLIDFGRPVAPVRDPSTGEAIPNEYAAQWGIRVVRDASDQPFRDPNGNVAAREQAFTFFIYKPVGQRPVLKLDNPFFRAFLRSPSATYPPGLSDHDIDKLLPAFNGVIYAEGNVRVRGVLPSKFDDSSAGMPIRYENQAGDPDQLTDAQIRQDVNPPAVTVVSGANIYVEGSIVREAPSSMVALLAHDYVVVNTTMFVAPNKGMAWNGTAQDEQPPYHTTIGLEEGAQTPPFAVDFLNGEDVTQYGTPVYLLARHGVATGSTFLNLLINEAQPPAGQDPFYNFQTYLNTPLNDFAPTPIALQISATDTANGSDGFKQELFQLYPVSGAGPAPFTTVGYNFFTNQGDANTIRPQVDPNYTDGSPTQDYLLGRYAVEPMDVRIDAVLYAQTGSFFIIPGYSVNPNPNDTRAAALARATALGLPAGTYARPPGTDPAFPFYGEPYDCRITIKGAVSENRTASLGDQTAWNQLWGYIPDHDGSSATVTIPVAHANIDEVGGSATAQTTTAEQNAYGTHGGITQGLRFLYDPVLLAPYPSYNPDPAIVNRTLDPLNPQYEQPNTWYAATQANPATVWVNTTVGTYRQDDYGRYLPPIPRLPVCPGFVYIGEQRLANLF